MSDYIKREDAYRRLTEYYHHTREIQHESLRIALIGIPSADVAPVVRCRDCKWRNTIGCDSYVASLDRHCCEDDDFCKWGERKDDD